MTLAPCRRLFFALWPEDPVRVRLARAARSVASPCGGRPVPVSNFHMTLEFLGNVPGEAVDCLLACAAKFGGAGFRLRIDDAGSFARTGIVWLGSTTVPDPLTLLYEHLHAGVTRCGLTPENRPFRPHVTVLRRSRRGPAAAGFEPIDWDVDAFVLVESVRNAEGSRYEVIGRWPLMP